MVESLRIAVMSEERSWIATRLVEIAQIKSKVLRAVQYFLIYLEDEDGEYLKEIKSGWTDCWKQLNPNHN